MLYSLKNTLLFLSPLKDYAHSTIFPRKFLQKALGHFHSLAFEWSHNHTKESASIFADLAEPPLISLTLIGYCILPPEFAKISPIFSEESSKTCQKYVLQKFWLASMSLAYTLVNGTISLASYKVALFTVKISQPFKRLRLW